VDSPGALFGLLDDYDLPDDVASVLAGPVRTERQTDGRVRRWGWIPCLGRWLRVVTETALRAQGMTIPIASPARPRAASSVASGNILRPASSR
jgi:hypothetical protein